MTYSQRHRDVKAQGDKLFSERSSLESLWQEIAENFYPERADFTSFRGMEHFADGLDTSFPILAARDLADALGSILRPGNTEWFDIGIKREENLDDEGRRWLAMAKRVMWRAIYDKESQFVRATKEGDRDFVSFGQCVVSSEVAARDTGATLLHRCWHLRDAVWKDDSFGSVGHVSVQWKPTAAELIRLFPKTVDEKVVKAAEKEPYTEINCRHVIVRSDEYDYKDTFKKNKKYVSLYIDCDNETVLEEISTDYKKYVIPRWKTVAGSQYAYSPAAIAALADARLIQAMTFTILTAGENMVNPPLVGVAEAIRGGIETFPGGFTAVDAQYDERLGEVLRPLNKGGDRALPVSLDMIKDIRAQIREAFFLSKLAMPPAGEGGMSPFEVQQRVAEFIRQAMPLFEPAESEYNGELMDQNFRLLMDYGAFGPRENIPESLMGQDTQFIFKSPIRQSIDQMTPQKLAQALQIAAQVGQIDPAAAQMLNMQRAAKDAYHGAGTPPEWILTEEEIQAKAQAAQQAQGVAQMMDGMGKAAPMVKAVADAAKEAAPQEVAYDETGSRR